MKKLFLLLIAALLINCRNDADFKNVALESTIIDSIYTAKKKDLNDLCNKILAIGEINTDLEKPLMLGDTLNKNIDDEIILKILTLKVDSTFLSVHEPFSISNTIYINRYTNLSEIGGMKPDTISAEKNYKFDIELFDPEGALLSKNSSIWNRHQSKKYAPDFNDSITQSTVKHVKQSNNDYLQNILKAKYTVFVQDLYYLKPRLIDKKTFEGGILVTNVKIYDLSDGKKIGQASLFITSSEKINSNINVLGNDQFNEMLIEQNMAQQRISAVNEFLKTGKVPEIK